jgi:hypothetical protein
MPELKLRADATSLRALYGLMQRNGDVHFHDIYLALGGDPKRLEERDSRGRHYAQSWSSGYITKLNRKLKPMGERISPGRLRQTYRLTTSD